MTRDDFDAFVQEFGRLSAALERFKQSPDQVRARADAYFHVLKHLPLSDVTAKADAWLAHEQKFPAPVQWVNQIVSGPAIDYRTMTDAESRAYREAEEARWQGEPCTCAPCQAAGVTHRFLRFVPDVDRDGRDVKARDGLRNRIVTTGHWAHGEELRRWYLARDHFFALAGRLGHATDVEVLR